MNFCVLFCNFSQVDKFNSKYLKSYPVYFLSGKIKLKDFLQCINFLKLLTFALLSEFSNKKQLESLKKTKCFDFVDRVMSACE